ncbi:MAG: ORF6N domain-containing protein [Bacteroidia bacterium]
MSTTPITPDEILVTKIHFIRGQKVMIDRDLAELYVVETKQLKRQVNRNIDRFPQDFMFQITKEELESLRSQFGTLKRGEHTKFLPFAFTEQGVAMLSSVLSSKQAIAVNIQIIRVFTRMREIVSSNREVLIKLEQLEASVNTNRDDIEEIFSALQKLLDPELPPRDMIGYKPNS